MCGASDGNRTHAASLEGWNSTIELHPHLPDNIQYYNMGFWVCQGEISKTANFFCAFLRFGLLRENGMSFVSFALGCHPLEIWSRTVRKGLIAASHKSVLQLRQTFYRRSAIVGSVAFPNKAWYIVNQATESQLSMPSPAGEGGPRSGG